MQQSRRRLMFMAYLMLIIFLLLAVRFLYLQTFMAGHLQQKVVQQRVKEIVQKPERGKIVDKNDEVLAYSLLAKDIALYPNLITSQKQKDAVATLLSKQLNMSYNDVMKKINVKDKNGKPLQWVALAKRVDPDVAKKIQDANLGGIEISNSPKRYYPNGTIASSILGFVNDEGEPGAGMELKLNNYLSGVPGYTLAETDSVGKVIPIGFQNISNPIDGQTVKLTIDTYLQSVMENELNSAVQSLQAEAAYGVMMDPHTGAILAMAGTPGYDPNNYQKAKASAWNSNPATFTYEPGSIFKPTFMAMAMDMGKINNDTHFMDSNGSVSVGGTFIHNDNGEVLGNMSLQDVIVHSSNVGMVDISKLLTPQEEVGMLKKAGFGQTTGVELSGEEMGLFPTVKSLQSDPIRKATISFGQGISVTPVMIARSFSQLINGGHPINAHLVDNITDNFGNVTYTPPMPESKQLLYKQSTVDYMKSYLYANMLPPGTGAGLGIPGVKMGGKTGTAWLVENGKYLSGQIIGSFMGFAPYDNPQIVLLVSVVKPHNGYGATSAGPAWHNIMQETLRYMSLNKADQKAKSIDVPNVQWLLADDATNALTNDVKNVSVVKSGDGNVVTDREYAYVNNQVQVTLLTKKIKESDGYYIPNLLGKTTDEVNQLFKGVDIPITIHGAGIVKEQNLKPGYYKEKKDLILWTN